jgi:cell division initiation protein
MAMRLTPIDIRQQQFTVRTFRGLDRQEVETFLEDVAEDFENILKEAAILKEQLATHEERARSMASIEKTLRDTLVTTQKLAEEMRENAQREAQALVRDAELRGEKILDDTRAEEARIRADIQMLKRTRRQLVEELKSTVDMYQRLIATDLSGEGGDVSLPRADGPAPR